METKHHIVNHWYLTILKPNLARYWITVHLVSLYRRRNLVREQPTPPLHKHALMMLWVCCEPFLSRDTALALVNKGKALMQASASFEELPSVFMGLQRVELCVFEAALIIQRGEGACWFRCAIAVHLWQRVNGGSWWWRKAMHYSIPWR